MNRLLSTVLAVLPYLLIVGPLLVLAVGVLLVVVGAYTREWEWTSFLDKTLWDWMKLLIVPIILALGGVLITQMDRLNSARRLAADREQAQAEQSFTRQGQITDRFARAIDQLGKTDARGNRVFEVRLGGIYALEQIARDSEQDYWPIMEVLAAYVRQHAPWTPEEDQQGEEDSREATETTKVLPPAPDIQAITAVLRRRNRYFGHGEPEPLDLALTNLSRANLSGAYLSRANLSGANFSEAYLAEANLLNANFSSALLSSANLQGADLRGAYLQGAYLQGADLEGANLQQADLQVANLKGAKVTDEQLADTLSLQGTTMPNGQRYEEWIKSRGEGDSGS